MPGVRNFSHCVKGCLLDNADQPNRVTSCAAGWVRGN